MATLFLKRALSGLRKSRDLRFAKSAPWPGVETAVARPQNRRSRSATAVSTPGQGADFAKRKSRDLRRPDRALFKKRVAMRSHSLRHV